MSIVLFAKMDLKRMPMETREIRVLLVGPLGLRTRQIRETLDLTGSTVEEIRTTELRDEEIIRAEFDIMFLVLSTANENAILERIRTWRRIGLNQPIVVVGGVDKTVLFLDAGADECLPPTIEEAELASRINALLRRRGVKPRVIKIFDLEIDASTRTVKRAGQTISLTPREYAILEILAEHRGNIVSRMTIWQRLYRESERYASNVVDVYIRYLRQKIDKDFTPPLILTSWGRGYMIRGEDTTP